MLRRLYPIVILTTLEFLLADLIFTIQADTLTVCATSCDYASIQEAINNAASGDTISIAAGVYTEALNITTARLTLQGAGPDSVTINTSGSSGYGIHVAANNVTLQGFTLIGPKSGGTGYGLKIEGASGITVTHVTVEDSDKSGIDLNGVSNALLADIVVRNNRANGLAFTDVSTATIRNITTAGNVWGGVALYTYGRYYPGGSTYIILTGTNSFAEANPLYVELGNYSDPANPYPLTSFSQFDFSHTVKNVNYPTYTFYQLSESNAIAYALAMTLPDGAYINRLSDGSFVVAPGLSLQTAADVAADGATIRLTAGVFTQSVTLAVNRLTLSGAGAEQTVLQGTVDCSTSTGSAAGISLSAGISGTTITGLTVTGFDDGIQLFTGPITNTTIQNTATISNCRHGIYSSMSSGFSGLTLNRVDASYNNTTGPQRWGRGIWVINGVKQNIVIRNSTFNGNRLVGIDISDGNVTGLEISGNQVANNGDSGIAVLGPQGPGVNQVLSNTVTDNGRFGIEIKNPTSNSLDTVEVSGNTVQRTTPSTDLRDHAGIAVFRRYPTVANADQPTGVVISGNVVSGYRVSETAGATGEGFGIVIEGHSHRAVNNIVFDNDVGVQLQAANPSLNEQNTPYFDRGDASETDATVSGNAIYSNTIGLRVLGPVTGTITANTIYTNTTVGLQVLDEAATGVTASVDNHFCYNGLYGMENRGTSTVDATGNWWGAVDGPGPVGGGNSVSAGVSYVPFQSVSPATGPCSIANPAPPNVGIYLPIIARAAN